MVSPKVMEAWFTLMAEAMKGTQEAQEAFQSLSKLSADAEDLSPWLAKFMPAALASSRTQPETFEAWLEDWWRTMGVVPRSRYLDLLEKYDQVQRRLEKAQQTIDTLRAQLGQTDQQEETQKVLDMWSSMLQDTLKTQSEWMQNWMEPPETAAKKTDAASADQADPPPSKSSPE